MPEGHSIHRLARAITAAFGDTRVRLSSPQGRFAEEAAQLDGWHLHPADAFGKHLFLPFSPDADTDPTLFVHIHLGLYGSWTFAGDADFATAHAIGAPRNRIHEEGTDWRLIQPGQNVRLRITGHHGLADLTGPNQCRIVDSAGRAEVTARLGPDPLRADADPDVFVDVVKRSRTTIGALLMNQQVVAGIGNIYRAELLFRARLDPTVPGRDLSRPAIRAIWDDLVPLIRYGRRTGRIVTTQPEHRAIHAAIQERSAPTYQNDDDHPDAVPREESFYVYHRQNLPCRICDATIRTAMMQGRTVFWCPRCQRRRVNAARWILDHPAGPWAEPEGAV
ncbi:Fpg/Nei family DNA glycosylase [Helcobacillus massiliensis]|uniref:Fpg/Nei family DNA glycosylase n=1 Tax=Helcobacillus massiliensis TaxID=521392 RepID=UPI0021A64A48|nr:Fpg/Nei family DNA glycosylase [Helcobacillus massiliensis]MCT1558473.1 Fpg/Nei family DNA glycosylase [Helcobacillus massiliensis]MCT2037138.1 Fpg/Nei family DNA glycosylase [Helcobacillus massiliensis]MCT2332074.1 Fpg/Nei family DNA glycosylase [Helcobacillus massiliensis]